MTDLSYLIERVRKAEGPDREIDHEFLSVAGWRLEVIGSGQRKYWTKGDDYRTYFEGEAPHYTASIDAITALIEKKLPDWHIASGTVGEQHDQPWCCLTEPFGDHLDFAAYHVTEALARTEAFLLALQESSK